MAHIVCKTQAFLRTVLNHGSKAALSSGWANGQDQGGDLIEITLGLSRKRTGGPSQLSGEERNRWEPVGQAGPTVQAQDHGGSAVGSITGKVSEGKDPPTQRRQTWTCYTFRTT